MLPYEPQPVEMVAPYRLFEKVYIHTVTNHRFRECDGLFRRITHIGVDDKMHFRKGLLDG